jgi:diaminopimelate decarboxylase
MAAVTIPSVRMIGLYMQIGLQITTHRLYAGPIVQSVPLISRMRRIGHPIAWYNREEVSGAPA